MIQKYNVIKDMNRITLPRSETLKDKKIKQIFNLFYNLEGADIKRLTIIYEFIYGNCEIQFI